MPAVNAPNMAALQEHILDTDDDDDNEERVPVKNFKSPKVMNQFNLEWVPGIQNAVIISASILFGGVLAFMGKDYLFPDTGSSKVEAYLHQQGYDQLAASIHQERIVCSDKSDTDLVCKRSLWADYHLQEIWPKIDRGTNFANASKADLTLAANVKVPPEPGTKN